MKTLYVTDLDGTLLTQQSDLSPFTILELNRLLASGALVTVATARTPATVVPLLSEVDFSLPMILLSGATLWMPRERQYCEVRAMDEDTVKAVVDVFDRHGLVPFVYRRHGDMLHAHHHGKMTFQEAEFVRARSELPLKRFYLNTVPLTPSDDEALLVFSIQDHDVLEPVAEELSRRTDCSPVFYNDIFDARSGLLEVYSRGTGKAASVKALAERIGAERVVVFGDNRNDLEMLSVATHSVAVGNAVHEVLDMVDEVIGNSNDDSVVRWIAEDFKRTQS